MKFQVAIFLILIQSLVFKAHSNYFLHSLNNDSIKSKIIFIRPYSFKDYSESYKIYVNDTFVVRLLGNSYYELECKKGNYNIRVKNYKKYLYNLQVDSNKTYYINIKVKYGLFASKPVYIFLDSIYSNKIINNGRIRKIIKNKHFLNPKNRIGYNFLNTSFGFEKIKLIQFADGSYSSLSFGGGYSYVINYGYSINKLYDLSFELNYKISKLIPKVSNADIIFKRYAVSIIPSLIIPIDGGDAKRIRLGIGADYYFPSKLSNNIRINNGIYENWRYSETLGYQINLTYEQNVAINFSWFYAIKYYNVKYKFEKGGLYRPSTTQFNNPDGSSIELFWGVCYHFR
ncbi:MAG: hypothetical protein A2046_12805 [Bacteroidetes bacterium GWA2_30_7]|nr:MAG: hypothetical protein A2046_12805 [Bacteroidetes bacterium GWA2_30_7]